MVRQREGHHDEACREVGQLVGEEDGELLLGPLLARVQPLQPPGGGALGQGLFAICAFNFSMHLLLWRLLQRTKSVDVS